ncbi:MAG: tRNA (adenosine(37)-N6)-dimethylallyltransferase MiaA [Actinobacteria bacterium]|nr:tRNA (adenosine(37)-N6)-dimethylallyltransferase MiaA [Actinomycetota bacterium]
MGADRTITPGSPLVVAIFGPTASGKSAVAEAVADGLGTEVVSADAMQVYRGLPLLTNQPERPTRLVAIRELGEEMSVGAYAPLAHAAIDELVRERGVAVVTGGTGLYLRAALGELRVPPPAAGGVRARIEAEYDRDPADAYARLHRLDARAAAAVHENDRRRVVRALELAEAGATLVSDDDRLWSRHMRLPTLQFGLDVAPSTLEQRIRDRTRTMFERGVAREVAGALAAPVSRTAAKTLGLAEIAGLSPQEAEERIVVRTRRYAAYQRKWMRRIPDLAIVDGNRPPGEVASAIVRAVAAARSALSRGALVVSG